MGIPWEIALPAEGKAPRQLWERGIKDLLCAQRGWWFVCLGLSLKQSKVLLSAVEQMLSVSGMSLETQRAGAESRNELLHTLPCLDGLTVLVSPQTLGAAAPDL